MGQEYRPSKKDQLRSLEDASKGIYPKQYWGGVNNTINSGTGLQGLKGAPTVVSPNPYDTLDDAGQESGMPLQSPEQRIDAMKTGLMNRMNPPTPPPSREEAFDTKMQEAIRARAAKEGQGIDGGEQGTLSEEDIAKFNKINQMMRK